MIAASLADWIGSQVDLTALSSAFKAFQHTPDLVLGELQAPYALVDPLTEGAQELWVIGDAQRKENPRFQVSFFATSEEMMRQFEARFRRLIESAKSLDDRGVLIPGIDFKAFADLLIDSGDHQNYLSNQPGWFASPAPTVYKNEDGNGEPVQISTGFSIDSANGKVIFSPAIQASDKVRATYKMGVVDFNILGVAHFPTEAVEDVANNPQRYVVAFTLEAFYYIKTNANRWL